MISRPLAVVLCLIFALLTINASAADQPIRIAIAGDSTARDYTGMSGSYAELRGWGQYLADYMAAGKIEVLNHGKGGCSSKSFINEGRWQKLLDDKPDYVLIQFGHNDNPGKGPKRETITEEVPSSLPTDGLGSDPMDWYRNNIRTYIEQARSAGAVPVIVTPMERRSFKSNGKAVRQKNKPWADAAVAVAKELDAPVINLNSYSIDLLNGLGFEGCLFMHPTREGELHNTHYNEIGARIYAEYIVEQLGKVVPDLAPLAQLPETRTVDSAAEH